METYVSTSDLLVTMKLPKPGDLYGNGVVIVAGRLVHYSEGQQASFSK
jgi:hypothetical protein